MGMHVFPRRRNSWLRFGAWAAIALVAVVATVLLVIGRAGQHGHQLSVVSAKEPRIISLVPGATEILVSIGCRDHLTGVSNYDFDPLVANLPHVGDYQRADWEMISSLRPQWIITQYGPGQTPAGFIAQIDALGARRLNLQTETIDSADKTLTIYYAIEELGKACNEPEKASLAVSALRARLAAIRKRTAAAPPVPALIVIGGEGNMAAGKETFLDELLEIAGGVNIAASLKVRYPRIDGEQLLALQPQVILQLIPNGSAQELNQSKVFWTSFPDLPAVKNHRVVQLTAWYLELPGYHVADVAEQFSEALHPAGSGAK